MSIQWTIAARWGVPNKKVAAKPFPVEEPTKQKVVGGVINPMMMGAKGALVGLEVVFGNADFPEGGVVYVRADRNKTSTWGKDVYSIGETEFILVPEDEILVFDRNQGSWPSMKRE